MIYRNSQLATTLDWRPEPNPDAGDIARDFLLGEYDLLRFVRADTQTVSDLSAFLDATEGLSFSVQRSVSGDLLVSAHPWAESLLLTGRTADVLCGYIDRKIVRMADRFDMTVRQAVRAVSRG